MSSKSHFPERDSSPDYPRHLDDIDRAGRADAQRRRRRRSGVLPRWLHEYPIWQDFGMGRSAYFADTTAEERRGHRLDKFAASGGLLIEASQASAGVDGCEAYNTGYHPTGGKSVPLPDKDRDYYRGKPSDSEEGYDRRAREHDSLIAIFDDILNTPGTQASFKFPPSAESLAWREHTRRYLVSRGLLDGDQE